MRIRRIPGDTQIVGEYWHADTSCMAALPSGGVLYGVDVFLGDVTKVRVWRYSLWLN